MMKTTAITIRSEKREDFAAIAELIATAFESLPVSNHTEQFIVEALRTSGALTLSLVAEVDGKLVGHIAFSPVTVSDGTLGWYGLGPVSVLPRHQRMGIGKALIQAGLAQLRNLGAAGCCLVGNSQYYKRFGFVNVADFRYPGAGPEVFLAQVFSGNFPHGNVTYHRAFSPRG